MFVVLPTSLLWLAACSTPAPPAPPVPAVPSPAHADHEEVRLAALMLRFQVHADKLWFAGEAQNWPLAGFYAHELEETLEEIVDAELHEEGHDLSAMATNLLVPRVEAIEAAVKAQDGFPGAYDDMVKACNTCHRDADHGFVVIQRPTQPAFGNQDFRPIAP